MKLQVKNLISGTPMETGGHLSQPGTPMSNGTLHEPTPPPLEMMIFSPGNTFFKSGILNRPNLLHLLYKLRVDWLYQATDTRN
jgi:hypothetical protein